MLSSDSKQPLPRNYCTGMEFINAWRAWSRGEVVPESTSQSTYYDLVCGLNDVLVDYIRELVGTPSRDRLFDLVVGNSQPIPFRGVTAKAIRDYSRKYLHPDRNNLSFLGGVSVRKVYFDKVKDFPIWVPWLNEVVYIPFNNLRWALLADPYCSIAASVNVCMRDPIHVLFKKASIFPGGLTGYLAVHCFRGSRGHLGKVGIGGTHGYTPAALSNEIRQLLMAYDTKMYPKEYSSIPGPQEILESLKS